MKNIFGIALLSALLGATAIYGQEERAVDLVKPLIRSQLAYTVKERDLLPEGIAYDPVKRKFYLGSIYKSKILAIDEKRGGVTEFVSSGRDGLLNIAGLKVDAARRHLWVCTFPGKRFPQMKGYSAIHKYDLESGKLLKKYTAQTSGESDSNAERLFNDLAIARNGDVYFTDSAAERVYRIQNKKEQMQIIAQLEKDAYPNGIALSTDEKFLYVAQYNGIEVIDLATGKSRKFETPPGESVAAVDGLARAGDSLIGIQNLSEPPRVIKIKLEKSGTRAEKIEILESNHPDYKLPTTGTVVAGKYFYYIANSQLRSFDEQGRIFPPDKLQEVKILKLPLQTAAAAAASESKLSADKSMTIENQAAKKEIAELVKARAAALVRNDVAFFEKLIAKDFSYISSDGATSDREAYLKRLTSGDYRFQQQNVSDIRVWLNGKTAVASCILDDKFNFRGTLYEARYRTVHVYVREGSNWKWLVGQTTEIAKSE